MTKTTAPRRLTKAQREAANAAAAAAAVLATVRLPDPEQVEREARAAAAEEAANLAREAEELAAEAAAPATGYTGPMLKLRERLKAGAYRKAANGQPCCGDDLAQALGALTPVQTIRACIIALNLEGNPYLHLNIGQQSMNLRNKLRGALKRGDFGMGVVREAVEAVTPAVEEPAAA